MPPAKTTPRRSRRFAPASSFVAVNTSNSDVLEDFLYDNALVAKDHLPSAVSTGNEVGVTRFYAKFRRKEEDTKTRRGRKNSPREAVFSIGDTVLLSAAQGKKSGAQPAHNVGVITHLWDVELKDEENPEDGGKYVKVHWFLRQDQLPKVRGERECEPNEIYYCMSNTSEATPLAAIVQHCTVSPDPLPDSEIKPNDTTFVCLCATDPRRDFFYSIAWEADVRKKGMERGEWDVVPAVQSRGRKRKRDEVEEAVEKEEELSDLSSSSGEDGDEYEEEDVPSPSPAPSLVSEHEGDDADATEDDDEPITPTKRASRKSRKVDSSSSPSHTTPRKRGRQPKAKGTTAKPTPHSKAALLRRQRAKKGRKSVLVPVPSNSKWLASLPEEPHARALATLHVSATPDELPCRQVEFESVLGLVENMLEEGGSGCLYISGVPGTGKTATVHAVVRTLHARAQASEIPPFTFVTLNGLKLADPKQAYVELWRVISGEGDKRISPNEALSRLTQWFEPGKRAGPEGGCFVVLMDELDQLITPKQDVVYNFFNWPTLPGSRMIVIAVANTMDLPERAMAGKVKSRLGMQRLNFTPYVRPQLEEIVQSRLSLAAGDAGPEPLMSEDAVKLVCMKVGGITGDARRVLDVCRRAVELARLPDNTYRCVNINDVTEVMRQMQNSPTASYLRQCSFMEKVMLVALVKVIRNDGVAEVKWTDVAYQHSQLLPNLCTAGVSYAKVTLAEQRVILGSLVAARVILLEEGALAMRKGEGERKVCLGLESGEVERVLSEYGTGWASRLGAS